MTLAEYVILGSTAAAFLIAGSVNGSWGLRITTILETRHPEVWATLQGRWLPSRSALAAFLRSDAHQQMDDPELSHAIRMDKITGRITVACFLCVVAALWTINALPR